MATTRRGVLAAGIGGLAAGVAAPASASAAATGRGELAGRTALVTGGARGIGRATAVRLAELGADVALVDVAADLPGIPYPMATPADLAETRRLVRALGRRCLAIRADVRDAAALRAAAARTVRELGGIDVLFSNAGVATLAAPLTEMTDAQWRVVLDVNLTGQGNALRAVLPHMVSRGRGAVVANASVGGRTGTPGVANYGAAKWGVIGLAKAAALEVAADGVRVNVVCPTFVDTELTWQGTSLPGNPRPTRAELEAAARASHPLAVGVLPASDVAETVAYLVSDRARYVTGEVVDVAAGVNARWAG